MGNSAKLLGRGDINQARNVKVLLVIAIVAVIGFSIVSCGDLFPEDDWKDPEELEAKTNGQLTITGLSVYNNYEIEAYADKYGERWLYAYANAQNTYDPNGDGHSWGSQTTRASVSNGEAVLKVFEDKGYKKGKKGGYGDYTGSDMDVKFEVTLVSRSNEYINGSVTVVFTNGKANGVFKHPLIPSSLKGTWTTVTPNGNEEIMFDPTNYIMEVSGNWKGSYYSDYYGNTISITVDQMWGKRVNNQLEARWYLENELYKFYEDNPNITPPNGMFPFPTYNNVGCSLIGDSLAITREEGGRTQTVTYTRKTN